jgi:hypothetical protein
MERGTRSEGSGKIAAPTFAVKTAVILVVS